MYNRRTSSLQAGGHWFESSIACIFFKSLQK